MDGQQRNTLQFKLKSHKDKPFLGLSHKLLFVIFLVSGVFTLGTTAFRYYLDFKEEIGTLEDKFLGVQHTTAQSLATHIWEVNDAAVKSRVQGLLQIDDFIFTKVTDAKGKEVVSEGDGGDHRAFTEERAWKLTYDGEFLGKRTVVANPETREHHMLKASGHKIGVNLDVKYNVKEMQLKPGDNLFLYTGGLVEDEAISESPFLNSTILDLITKNYGGAEETHHKLEVFLTEKRKQNQFEDDVATMLISWQGSLSQLRKAS